MRVLLIEDERSLSEAVCQVLKKEHIIADAAYTGTDGLYAALTGIYDAIILDVMLPEMDGFTVLKNLRREGITTPIMMLTARGGLKDRVAGLDAGADYYLPKPFQMAELLACIRTITRRKDVAPVQHLSFGDIELIEREAKLVCRDTKKSVRLGAKEAQILELFLRNFKQILPKEMIMEKVWGLESDVDYNSLEVYLTFIRKKLTFVGSHIKIKAIRGLGYTLEDKS